MHPKSEIKQHNNLENNNSSEQYIFLDKYVLKFLKNMEWQDYALIILIITIVIIQAIVFSQLKHLAGPVYGGDIYRERGFTQTILNGIPFWESPLSIDEYAYFPWLSYLMTAMIVKIFPISLDTTINFLPILFFIMFSIGGYLLGKNIFRSKTSGIFLAILLLLSKGGIVDKTTSGLAYACMIWFLYFWTSYDTDNNPNEKKHNNYCKKIIAGILLGCTALSHGAVFINSAVFFASGIIGFFLIDIFSQKITLTHIHETVKKHFLKHYITAIIAIAISLLFFGPIIIKYHLATLNNAPSYASNIDMFLGFNIIITFIKSFLDVSNPFTAIIKFMAIIGLILCLMNAKKRSVQLTLFFYIGTLLATMHILVTKPLLNKWMEPWHVYGAVSLPIYLFFIYAIIGLTEYVLRNILKDSKNDKTKHAEKYVYIFIILFLLLPPSVIIIQNSYNNRWMEYGRTMDSQTKSLYELGNWLIENVKNNEVILANDESAFMINAMGGKRVVFSRRVHASYFEDIDKRYADGVVMLFGNNSIIVSALLKEYNVKYVYLDQFLIKYPIIVNIKYKQYLEENGIQYSIQDTRLDPSAADNPTFTSLVVAPNINSALLNESRGMIHAVQPFYIDQQIGSIIYEVHK